jgi:NAD-dependent deacetylase
MPVEPLPLSAYRNIVLLTGAGVSAASGLPTFRGTKGLWNDSEFLYAADGANLPQSLPLVWKVFGGLRALAGTIKPNAAHHAIAAMQKHYPDKNITLITQNVDGLHQAAGSDNVIELHGSVLRSRCTNAGCASQPFDDKRPLQEAAPCSQCGSPLRPDIVLFNEMLPPLESHRAKRALRDVDLFIAIGTSGIVSPAAQFVSSAAYVGARTILVNLEAMQQRNPHFQEEILGRAEEILPVLLKE